MTENREPVRLDYHRPEPHKPFPHLEVMMGLVWGLAYSLVLLLITDAASRVTQVPQLLFAPLILVMPVSLGIVILAVGYWTFVVTMAALITRYEIAKTIVAVFLCMNYTAVVVTFLTADVRVIQDNGMSRYPGEGVIAAYWAIAGIATGLYLFSHIILWSRVLRKPRPPRAERTMT